MIDSVNLFSPLWETDGTVLSQLNAILRCFISVSVLQSPN